MIQVIDNFIPKNKFIELKNFMESPLVKWNYIDGINKDKDENIERFQFAFPFYIPNGGPTCEEVNLLSPIFQRLNVMFIIRVKANLTVSTPEPKVLDDYHLDFRPLVGKGVKTGIYYINSNNGATLFETGQKVESVENRMVIFDHDIPHTGISCSDKKRRIVINFNYFPEID